MLWVAVSALGGLFVLWGCLCFEVVCALGLFVLVVRGGEEGEEGGLCFGGCLCWEVAYVGVACVGVACVPQVFSSVP